MYESDTIRLEDRDAIPYSGERRNTTSELESSMNQVQVEQKSYQMPPQDGFTVAYFLTVADIQRSVRFSKRFSEVAFCAVATVATRRGTSSSRTRGSSSTSGEVRPPKNQR